MFGNGLSSSPVEHAGLSVAGDHLRQRAGAAPRCCASCSASSSVACVYGWSMGALQAYHWAALFPDAVDAHRRQLRRRAHRRAQPGVPALADGDAGGRTAAYRQRPLFRRTACGEARVRAYLRGLGAQPGFLPGRPAPGGGPAAEPRRAGPGNVPEHRLGGPVRRAPRRQPLCSASHLGCRGYQRQRAVSTATCSVRCGRSGRACC